ncbi:hypothetical protein CUMW_054720 [Citrus unshiu]|nr:hypothetical protein CUMW_054720 [Citrus unshiu]
MEKSLSKEKRDWSVVVKETATAMVWLRRDGRDRDFENERIKNKSMMACLNMEPYMSHLRRKGASYCPFDFL